VTAFFLIRHGAHDLIGRVLTGRKADVPLNSEGRRQAARIAGRICSVGIDRILSSSRRRALQTAEIISNQTSADIETAAALDELDLGDWAGMSFDALARDPRWSLWNRCRSSARPPGGESMAELQARIVGCLRALAEEFPRERIALVSHAEPIRAVILYVRYIALDRFMDVPVDLASVHEFAIERPHGALVEVPAGSQQRGAA
jgi:probable phosphoglycerate mutase